MGAVFDIESGLKLMEEMLSRIGQLTADLNNKGVSSYGKDVLVEQLGKCVATCREPFKGVVQATTSLLNRCKDLEEKLARPQKLENEFKDIAKKLNFPITQATTDGVSCKNPNIEMSFEDPVPKKDIDFIKNYLAENKEVDVEIPKEEQLSDAEIKAYTCEKGISQLASNELSTLKSLNNIDGLLKNKVEKRKTEKSKRKKEKTKKDDGKKPTEVNK